MISWNTARLLEIFVKVGSSSEGTVSRVLWENGYSTCTASQLAIELDDVEMVSRTPSHHCQSNSARLAR
jgi:hypothetical protein